MKWNGEKQIKSDRRRLWEHSFIAILRQIFVFILHEYYLGFCWDTVWYSWNVGLHIQSLFVVVDGMVCNISTSWPTSVFHIILVCFKFHSLYIHVLYRIPHAYSARGRLTLLFIRSFVRSFNYLHCYTCSVFQWFSRVFKVFYFYEFIFDAENNDGHAQLCETESSIFISVP